jgi:hypothetical protein
VSGRGFRLGRYRYEPFCSALVNMDFSSEDVIRILNSTYCVLVSVCAS